MARLDAIYASVCGHPPHLAHELRDYSLSAPQVAQLSRMRDAGVPADAAEFAVRREDAQGRAWRAGQTWLALVQAFAADARTVVLCGPVGTGKSAAAAVMLSEMATGRWIGARRYAALSEWDGEIERLQQRVRLLVVDDLGVEEPTRAGRMQELLCERHAGLRWTIATSNLQPKDLRDRYGERVHDRLRERGAVVVCRERMRQARGK